MTCKICESCGQKIRGTRVKASASAKPGDRRVKIPFGREAQMVQMYSAGKTLQEIGDEFGVTRERIRQLLAKHGIRRKNGGSFVNGTVNAIARHRDASSKRELKVISTYGCDLETFRRLSLGFKASDRQSPMRKFTEQRHNAALRDIPWEMNFAQWMTIWLESGKWEFRGVGIGKYCMARKSDTGPYSVGNVYITTCDDNVRDYQARLKIDGVVSDDGYKRLPENPIFEVTE